MRSEKHSNSKKKMSVVLFFSAILVAFIAFYFFGKINSNHESSQTEATTHSTVVSDTSNESSSSTQATDTSETTIKEKNLTSAEIKEWVQTVLDIYSATNGDQWQYIIHDPVLSEIDQLSYVRVEVPQMDDLGQFRVNEKGELEASGAITGNLLEWTVLSDYFIDKQTAKDYFKKKAGEASLSKDKKETSYYMQIKEAMKRQQEYIDSIHDTQTKQSVQTAYSAAVAESTRLQINNPNDTELIEEMLRKVLDGK